MCRPVSLIITEDKVFLPPDNDWNHSHSFIMETHNIPDGLIGDKYLRLEVIPPEEIIFRNKETNKKLTVNNKWKVIVDEKNIPDWYKNDKPNQEDRAREAAKKWFQKFPDNLVPGYKEIHGDYARVFAGNYSELNAENFSMLIAEHKSTLTAKSYSTLIAKSYSTLTAGDYSKLTSGNNSELNSKNFSTLIAGDLSKLTAGSISYLSAGDSSVLTAGYSSDLNAGNNSSLTAGDYSTFCAGEKSSFNLIWHDRIKDRMRTATVYVGEDGIEPNKKYLGKDGKFEEVPVTESNENQLVQK